jgi:hypothetical protein
MVNGFPKNPARSTWLISGRLLADMKRIGRPGSSDAMALAMAGPSMPATLTSVMTSPIPSRCDRQISMASAPVLAVNTEKPSCRSASAISVRIPGSSSTTSIIAISNTLREARCPPAHTDSRYVSKPTIIGILPVPGSVSPRCAALWDGTESDRLRQTNSRSNREVT